MQSYEQEPHVQSAVLWDALVFSSFSISSSSSDLTIC